jgi:putative ABC transport system permease protein
MFRIRVRKILSDVWARKGRTFLVSFAIFIGVIGTIALFSMGDILVSQLREDLEEDELSMLDIFVTVNAGTPVDDRAYLDLIAEVDGVTEVQGEIVVATAYFKLTDDESEEFELGAINAFYPPYEPELPVEPIRLVEGAYPAEGADEIAVEQRMADEYDLAVGDTLYVRILSASDDPELNGAVGTVESRTIAGIVFDPYIQQAQPQVSLYSTMGDANYITGSTGLNAFSIRFTDFATAEAQADAVADLIANESPYRPVFTLLEDPAQNAAILQVQILANTMSFLAIVALIVSGFLVINVISSIVLEQKRQIGVMKSMGATRWDNVFIYSGIALMYGIIGVVPGVILGIPAGDAAAKALAGPLNTVVDGFRTSPPSIVVGVVVGLLVPVLASLIPVFNGTRVRILEAMTDLGIDARYGRGPLARLIGWLPVPITVRQGLSNVSIKKSRLAFTVITLCIAAGAFMGITATFNSLTNGINTFLDSFNVEVGVAPTQGRDPDEITTLLRENFTGEEDSLLERVEPGVTTQVEFDGYEPQAGFAGPPGIFAYGYDINSDDPAFTFTVDKGEPLTDENSASSIIFSGALARNMGKSVGDTVVMRVPGNTVELTIVGISEAPIDQVYLDWRTLALATNSTIARNAQSPIEIPPEAASFIRYATDVNVADAAVRAVGLAPQAVGQDGMLAQIISEGEMFGLGEQAVVISSALAESGGYTVGDTIALESTTEGGQTTEYTISGILNVPPVMQSDVLPAEFVAIFWENLLALDGIELETVPLPQAYFLVTTLDNPTVEQIGDVGDEITDVLLNSGISVQTINFVELTEQIRTGFQTFQVILQAVALLIALVGALGLLTTLSMSVFERQKEIGVMRSIGASSATVATQFLTEGLVVGIIAWLIGLPLAYLLARTLLTVTQLNETFVLQFSLGVALTGLVGMVLITIFASLWPSLSAARKTVSDILRYQ